VCSPADNIHTGKASSQGSNSINHVKDVFHTEQKEVFIPYYAKAGFVG